MRDFDLSMMRKAIALSDLHFVRLYTAVCFMWIYRSLTCSDRLSRFLYKVTLGVDDSELLVQVSVKFF